MNKILTVQTPSGNILLVLPDGQGGVVYRQLNGEIYVGSCENLELYCCEGADGEDGLSAYEIAVNNGFVGTEQEWLDSLVGADGSDGLSAYQIWLNEGNTGTEQDFLDSLIGPAGSDGAPGADGQDGTDGADGLSAYEIWLNEGNTGTEQDFLDSLVGPQGPAGADGQDGADFDPGLLGLDIQGTNVVLQYNGVNIDMVDICLIDCDTPSIVITDRDLGDIETGVTQSFDLSLDVASGGGCDPVTYGISNEVNCTVNFISINNIEVTPTADGPYSFDLTGTCDDGTTFDVGTVSGDGTSTLDFGVQVGEVSGEILFQTEMVAGSPHTSNITVEYDYSLVSDPVDIDKYSGDSVDQGTIVSDTYDSGTGIRNIEIAPPGGGFVVGPIIRTTQLYDDPAGLNPNGCIANGDKVAIDLIVPASDGNLTNNSDSYVVVASGATCTRV